MHKVIVFILLKKNTHFLYSSLLIQDAIEQPSLVIVYFGGNDCFPPHPSGLGTHVPLGEYIENLRKIANYIKVKEYYYFYFKFQIQFESLTYLKMQLIVFN
jgi:hypothetical protein